MRTAAKGSGAVFSSVASSAAAQPTGEKSELKATIGEIDGTVSSSSAVGLAHFFFFLLAALLNNAAPLPPTPPVAHAPLPTPKPDPIKSTIGEIDALLAQPAIATGSSSSLVASAPPSSSSVISVEEESVVMTMPAKKAADPPPAQLTGTFLFFVFFRSSVVLT